MCASQNDDDMPKAGDFFIPNLNMRVEHILCVVPREPPELLPIPSLWDNPNHSEDDDGLRWLDRIINDSSQGNPTPAPLFDAFFTDDDA